MSNGIANGSGSGAAAATQAGTAGGGGRLSSTNEQELVEQVADRVYAMLMLELRIEQERERFARPELAAEQGGWS
jgi:hypothetical protein